jgi:hypothetical protein
MIQIDEMVLRVPGLKDVDAAGLAAAVSQQLMAQLPDGMAGGRIDTIRMDIRSASRSQEELASAIAAEIITKIKIATI